MTEPELTIVVCAGADESPDATVEYLLEAAQGERDRLELILVAEGGSEATPRFDRALDVWPAGSGYARNRGLALARASRVAFLDAPSRVGAGWVDAALDRADGVVLGQDGNTVFPRDGLVAARGFDLSLGRIAGAGYDTDAVGRLKRSGTPVRTDPRLTRLGDPDASRAFARGTALGRVARRQKSVAPAVRGLSAARGSLAAGLATAAGVVVGAVRKPSQSVPALSAELIPPALVAELRSRELVPLSLRRKAKSQLMYRAGEDALLHIYLEPTPRHRRSLDEREAIRQRSPQRGIPRVLASAEGLDSLWVLEELLPGRPPDPSEVGRWFPAVADWAVAIGRPTGPALRESAPWSADRLQLVEEAPEHLRSGVEEAAAAIEALPSTPMHGDLQRTNVLVSTSGGVAVVDWEGAWLEGIPGLDLVFLALFAAGDGPDVQVARTLAEGGDVPWGGLRAALARVGVGERRVPSALLVLLATWSLAESRRRARLGAVPGEAVFRPLLEQVGPSLAERLR